MNQAAALREPAMRLVYEGKVAARVWKCGSCGLKLYLAQKSDYPSIRCLCGRACWSSCMEDPQRN